jgi:tetratricopeptide (TPR) repeat protein
MLRSGPFHNGLRSCSVIQVSALLSFFVTASVILNAIEDRRPAEHRAAELAYLPKGSYLRVASLGYQNVVADLLWIKVVQHLGNRNETAAGYLWAYHAADVLTDVDPKFAYAYLATGTVLGVYSSRIQESIRILQKGMQYNPDVWQLPYVAGYDYFYELCDAKNGAKYLTLASMIPGAPSYLPKLAARMSVDAGQPEPALEFLSRFIQQTADEQLRNALIERKKEVQVEIDIKLLQEAVGRYEIRFGKRPRRIDDLVREGIVPHIPEEPLGGKYELRAADGTIFATSTRERLRVYSRKNCGPSLAAQS